jgi:hypothetical protein
MVRNSFLYRSSYYYLYCSSYYRLFQKVVRGCLIANGARQVATGYQRQRAVWAPAAAYTSSLRPHTLVA